MKDKYIYILLLFSFLISFSHCFMFRLVDDYEKYCYKKYIDKGDQITANYIVASDKEELITVDLSYQKQGQQNKQIIWRVQDKDEGDYYSEQPLEEGTYELCFYPKKGEDFYVSMEFYSLYEEHNLKDMATHQEVKMLSKEIKEMKAAIDKIEISAKHLNSRNFRHMSLLREIISSLKRLTSLKIVALAILSVFQIYIIQKFFGPNKRVSTIKGSSSDKGAIL